MPGPAEDYEPETRTIRAIVLVSSFVIVCLMVLGALRFLK